MLPLVDPFAGGPMLAWASSKSEASISLGAVILCTRLRFLAYFVAINAT